MKTKGWKVEYRIDKWLNKIHNKEIKCSSRQGEYLLCEAKTCIQSLNSRVKLLSCLLGEKTGEEYFWKKCCEGAEQKVKEQSSTINQLQFDNDALSKIVEELRKENEKLKDDLSNCIYSNELLEREYKILREALSDISFRTPALGGDKNEMKRALLDIDEICRLVFDGEEILFRIKETGIYKLRNGKKAFVNCLNEKDKEVSGVIEGIFDDFYWNEDGTIKSEINYYTEDEKEFDIVGK